MATFMSNDGGKRIVIVTHHVQESFEDLDRASGQRKGVDLLGVQHFERIRDIPLVHVCDETLPHATDPVGIRGVDIDAKLLFDLAGAFTSLSAREGEWSGRARRAGVAA